MRHPPPLDGQSGDCAVVPDAWRDRLALALGAPSRGSPPVRTVAVVSLALLAAACAAKPGKAAKPAPAKTEVIGHETELLRLKLSPEAEQRLGVRPVKVGSGAAQASRSAPGEVVAAPLPGGLPLAASGDMATLGAAQARADGDVARARAELAVAEKALARADALVREEAGSQRARDEAEAASGVARAAHDAARAQRALLGPAVTGLGAARSRWVRVTVFSADLAQLRRAEPARVQALGDAAPSVLASPAAGPPGSNAAAGTVDLYYALPAGAGLDIGQRVAVSLPTGGRLYGVTAPASAVLRDIYGGEWVYVRTAPQTYERRRIEIARLDGGQALVARGLAPGAEVVTDGAAELFGVEFGAK